MLISYRLRRALLIQLLLLIDLRSIAIDATILRHRFLEGPNTSCPTVEPIQDQVPDSKYHTQYDRVDIHGMQHHHPVKVIIIVGIAIEIHHGINRDDHKDKGDEGGQKEGKVFEGKEG